MKRCGYCNTLVILGGKKGADQVFCNDRCLQGGMLVAIADQIPRGVVEEQVRVVHKGACPQCGGMGPVDVHTSYTVWSALIMTSWKSRPRISCRGCGVKSQLGGLVFSGLVGWWGFPWGLLMTPVQIGRNVVGMFAAPDSSRPSKQLTTQIKMAMASQLVEASQAEQEAV